MRGVGFEPGSTGSCVGVQWESPHLHIAQHGSGVWEDYLRFRDYLCMHRDVAEEYASLKRELAKKYRDDRDSYKRGKAEFTESVLIGARQLPPKQRDYMGRCSSIAVNAW
jgi:hypothetical protein